MYNNNKYSYLFKVDKEHGITMFFVRKFNRGLCIARGSSSDKPEPNKYTYPMPPVLDDEFMPIPPVTPKCKVQFNKTEYAVVVGTMLGDATCEERSYFSSRLSFRHSGDQFDFISWKKFMLTRFVPTSPDPEQDQRGKPPKIDYETNKRTGKKYCVASFKTSQLAILHPFRMDWYVPLTEEQLARVAPTNNRGPKNRKIIPKNIESMLSPLAIFTLYCDDGCINSNENTAAASISMTGFSVSDQDMFIRVIDKLFGITFKRKKDGVLLKPNMFGDYQNWVVETDTDSGLAFYIKIIRPYEHLVPAMYRKWKPMRERFEAGKDPTGYDRQTGTFVNDRATYWKGKPHVFR